MTAENGENEEGDQEVPYQPLPLTSIPSSSSKTALHLAVSGGSIDKARHILQNGGFNKDEIESLLTTKDELGFTPLFAAVSLPSVALSKTLTGLLLSAGAEINSIDPLENTPLHWAVRTGNADTAQLLITNECPIGKTG